ncbi:MAG TPA: type II toxin-antitoxin system RelE/ParE family toxin [Beijerinckiaceae bacterium]|nr:addiction module toxin, RelE/StbE family [Microvirga sp.]HZB38575.1 type II toxin-antitoxin system RelE/ParE family toxin [Beijerinckiaceae bacterium]
MRVIWTPRAAARLSAINDHIAEDSPQAAARVAAEIVRRASDLADFPFQGRPGRLPNTRELVVAGTPYIVIYRVGRERIDILRVVHGAQRWPPRF